ncbi:50S ribosomal protein L22 [Candidatus Gottesmanbacteria bacterium]|nr:50S ribosomal protein L22 [Candidatus Gottesmanbacteria bacterium]
MEYTATAKYVRISTRKMRLVADSIRTLAPTDALAQLSIMPKAAAEPLASVIASALANAKQKNVDSGTLRFKNIEVMGGPSMKRWHAVSRGNAHAYKKRMTHIRIVLMN